MVFYCVPAGIVLLITVRALMKDDSTPNTDQFSWLLIGVATLAWPITLPMILRKKIADAAQARSVSSLNHA